MTASAMPCRSGAFVIDKPVGASSSQVVTRIKWALVNSGFAPKTLKIGHGGTLDPFASGVLVVLFGEGTKLSDCYLHSKKSYSGRIALGRATDSGDLTGTETGRAAPPAEGTVDWQTLADSFVSAPYLQTPPMHSAKKRDGVPLYDLARKGITIEREAIQKKIERFQVRAEAPDLLFFETTCESGTYVRVLACDLAHKAGTLAHLRELRRTRSSDRTIEESASCDSVEKALNEGTSPESIPGYLPLSALASHVPSLPVDEDSTRAIRAGLHPTIERLLSAANSAESSHRYLVLRRGADPVALLERSGPGVPFRLQRVLNPPFFN